MVEAGDHQLLFLPKYSPDLNDIEHDFSALKRAIAILSRLRQNFILKKFWKIEYLTIRKKLK